MKGNISCNLQKTNIVILIYKPYCYAQLLLDIRFQIYFNGPCVSEVAVGLCLCPMDLETRIYGEFRKVRPIKIISTNVEANLFMGIMYITSWLVGKNDEIPRTSNSHSYHLTQLD